MRIALFLPHVGVFGGVRRFVELGNAWSALGHEVTLFHPAGTPPGWLPFAGRTLPLEAASSEASDVAFGADPHTFAAFVTHRSGAHVYYCVIEGDPGVARALAEPDVRLAANSGALLKALRRRAHAPVLDGIGGINTRQFTPDATRRAQRPLRVLVNGRRSRAKKGTDLVLAALAPLVGRVPGFEIVLFDSVGEGNVQDPRRGAPLPPNARFVLDPTQAELVALYQSAHVFIAAERKAGWCNTALEALACGAALVCTPSGTADFARDRENARVVRWRNRWTLRAAAAELLRDPALRERLGAAGPATAERWSWDTLAAKLIAQVLGRR
ncbi:MAG TPA: glycosyltransferase family 4 protein [Candidatus Eisenbacteria bacterium]|nr:glycosyltransferase family 4 protein [Candidatus Eisenbacteria bacterium]